MLKMVNIGANVGSGSIQVGVLQHYICLDAIVLCISSDASNCLLLFVTGLFCMHLARAFTHLQVRKIPNKYTLKRYSRDARSFVEWDRNDIVKGGRDGNEEQMRFDKLIPIVMGIARAGSRSDYAYNETVKRATKLRCLIETIPANVTTESDVVDENNDATGSREMAVASPLSQTKGRGTRSQQDCDVTECTCAEYKYVQEEEN
jgi:hypothetical protein